MGEVSFFAKNQYFKYPRILQIEITTRCALHCPQCYKKIMEDDIDFNWLKMVLIEQHKYGLKSIMINGGEPLLYPNFFQLLELLDKLQLRSNCFSSGINIDRDCAKKMREYAGLFLNISLNGSTKHINNLSRDGYEVAIEAISNLSAEGTPFGINWVARRDNLNDFSNIIKLAEESGANNIVVVGNKTNSNGVLESPLSIEELKYLNALITEHEAKKRKPRIIIQQCYTELSMLHGISPIPINNGCPAGRLFCVINCKGEFMPCTHLPYSESFNSINEYWEKSKVLKEIRENTPKTMKNCSGCVNKTQCIFCRAVNEKTKLNLKEGISNCSLFLEGV